MTGDAAMTPQGEGPADSRSDSPEPASRGGSTSDGHPRAGWESLKLLLNWGRDRYLLATVAAATVVAVVTSWLQILNYESFYNLNGDLGTYNQALYTTVHNGEFFHYTVNIPAGSTGTVFAAHFSPILFLLVPIYALASSPTTLIVVKQIALASGAIPLYKLAELLLGSRRWGFFLALVYLLSPLTLLVDLTNFDPEVFLPLTVLSAFYYGELRRTVPCLVAWTFALSTLESASLLLLVFAAAWFVGLLWSRRPKWKSIRSLLVSLPALVIYLTLGWIALAFIALHVAGSGSGAFGSAYSTLFSVLGASSVPDVPVQVITHPGNAGAALSFQWSDKLYYAVLVFGSVGFLSLIGRVRYTIPVLFWIGFIALASSSKLYHFGLEYQAYPLPYVFAGLITGLARLGVGTQSGSAARTASGRAQEFRPGPSTQLLDPPTVRPWRLPNGSTVAAGRGAAVFAMVIVAAVLASNFVPGVSSPSIGSSAATILFEPHTESSHDRALNSVIAAIPARGSVFTTSKLFTYVSNRPDAYTIRFGSLFVPPWTYQSALDYFVNASQFVLLDYTYDTLDSQVFGLTANLTEFGVYAAADGAYVYARGWTAPPVVFTPENDTTPADQLNHGASTLVTSVPSPYGPVLYFGPGHPLHTELWSGPNIANFPVGEYRATLWMTLDAPSPGSQLELEVTNTPLIAQVAVSQSSSQGIRYADSVHASPAGPVTIASETLNRTANQSATVTANVTLDFQWPGYGYLNVKGLELSTTMSAYLYAMTLTQISA